MSRLKESRKRPKRFLVKGLSLGVMVLGIGVISWAMFNIWLQSHYVADAPPATLDTKQNKLPKDSGVPVESDTSIIKPQEKKILYPIYPSEGGKIGSITIPALNNRTISIYQGTGDKELKKGVGHFSQSVLPGEEDNCVLSAHRETGFRGIGDLKIGDLLIIKTSAGSFTYKVSGTRIVDADDKTVIVPTDHAVLTMTTCYPFNFIGNAPDRYIVSADLVKSK
jgi:sortase A